MFENKKIKKTKPPIKIAKAKYKQDKKKNSLLWTILWSLAIILILFAGINIIWNIKINTPSFEDLKNFKAEDSFIFPTAINWKVNILLIWKWGSTHNDAWALTDTIILTSIHKDKWTVSMFSVPRDLYVEFENWGEWKINDIYFKARKSWKTDLEAINELKRKVSEITWEQIPYYAVIDFKWFKEVIDSLWWIEINVPKAINDPYYPDSNFGYETFKIDKGLQTLDWETALKYARSRKTTSDFDRSIRQQLIIRAIKDRVESLGFLANPAKIRWTYLSVKNNFETNFKITEIISLGLYGKDIQRDKISTFNLNDSCYFWMDKCKMWGFMYYPPRVNFDNLSVSLPYWANHENLSNYDTIQRYTNLIFNYPEIFKENIEINVYNWTRIWWLAYKYANRLTRYWFNIPEENSIWNARDQVYKNSTIYYSWIPENSKTLEALWLFIFWEQIKLEKAKFSEWTWPRIEIVIWENFNSLTF